MAEDDKRSVAFLPWLRMADPLRVMEVDVYPLRSALQRAAGDVDLVRQIDAIVGQYRLDPFRSDNDAVICSCFADPFSSENADHYGTIREATRFLATSAIAANEYFRGTDRYINSSCFELVGQRFVVGDYHTAFVSRRRDGRTQDMGYPYNVAATLAPPWIRQSGRFNIDHRLLEGFCELGRRLPREFRRMLLAQEWFLAGWTDSPTSDITFDAVVIAAAFDQSHQSNMNPSLLNTIFTGAETQCKERRPLKGDWFKRFSDQRNAIVHGSLGKLPDETELWLDVFIASQVLLALWRRLLAERECYVLSKEDLDTEHRIDILIEKREPAAWNDIIEVVRRRVMANGGAAQDSQ
jgi:hypothetical protein